MFDVASVPLRAFGLLIPVRYSNKNDRMTMRSHQVNFIQTKHKLNSSAICITHFSGAQQLTTGRSQTHDRKIENKIASIRRGGRE